MPAPDVKVKIAGDDAPLRQALDGAQSSVGGFVGGVKGLLGGLAAAFVAVGLGKFFKDAIEEGAAAERGMIRLQQAVANTGTAFTDVSPQIDQTITRLARLTTFTDDDLVGALTNMVTITGDVQGSLRNLSTVADLAAGRQIDLGTAADLVGKAMNGNTTALNKVGIAGKETDVVIGNLRASFGGFAEKEGASLSGSLTRIGNQWGEFKEAVGTAINESGAMTQITGEVVKALVQLEEWVKANEGKIGDFALSAVRAGLAVKDWVAENAEGIASLVKFGATVVEIGAKVAGFFGAIYRFANDNVLGKLLGFQARDLPKAARDGWSRVMETTYFGTATVEGTITSSGKRVTQHELDQIAEREKARKEAAKKQLEAEKKLLAEIEKARQEDAQRVVALLKYVEGEIENGLNRRIVETRARADELTLAFQGALGVTMRTQIAATSAALNLQAAELQRLVDAGHLTREQYERANALLLTYKTRLSDLLPPAERMAEIAEEAADENARLDDELQQQKDHLDDNVRGVSQVARGALDLAQAFGLVDTEAASVLNSVISMAAALPKALGGDLSSIFQVIAGLANVIAGIGTSAAEQARREAVRRNTQAIDALRGSFDAYNLGVSGESFAGILGVLGQLELEGPTTGNIQEEGVRFLLQRQGIAFSDALKLAERFGIDVKAPGGWNALLAVLRSRQFGSPEGNFTDELDALESSFDVLGVDDEDDRLQQFREFLRRHIPAMADAMSGDLSTAAGRESAIAKLRALYTSSLTPGGLSPIQFGDATPAQFRQIIGSLLPLLGAADGTLGGGTPVAGAGAGGTSGSVLPSGVGSSVPTGGSVVGPRTFSGGAASGGYGGAFGAGSIGTLIEGDVNFYIDGAQDPKLVAEEVSLILGKKYSLQKTALGLA